MSSVTKFHIDRRAERVAADLANEDDKLLTTKQVAELFGISRQWLEIKRSKGGGPKFVKMSYRRVRYRMTDLRAWLDKRAHMRTDEYRRAK